MSKTVVVQKIQFIINTRFSSIWPKDRTLSNASTQGQSEPGSDGIEGYIAFPKTTALLERHH